MNDDSLARPRRASFSLTALTTAAVLAVGLVGCNTTDPDPAFIDGSVINSATEEPMDGALVQLMDAQSIELFAETATDADGRFSLELTIDSTMTFRIRASSTGFEADERVFALQSEQVLNLAPLNLSPEGEGNGNGNDDPGEPAEPRDPYSITLLNRTADEIGVSGSGSVETSTLTFVLLDGDGVALDEISSVPVHFELTNQPSAPGSSGAEFLYPTEVMSDEEGNASVTLTSGTAAGPVQVRATVEAPFGTIRSTPVVITIHGGLPDQDHFTIMPEQKNFHGRVVYGIENPIHVIVGDQHANPVQPDTEVYFTSSHGVISGAGATDSMGRTSSILQAAEPLPNGDGLGTITANTVGVDGTTVSASTSVLFSGPTRIELEYLGGALDNGGEHYAFRIVDDLDNPIVGGSTASVTVEGNDIRIVGDENVEIPDALEGGAEITDFEFWVRTDDPDEADLDNIVIDVSSPNGNRRYTYLLRPANTPGLIQPAEILEL